MFGCVCCFGLDRLLAYLRYAGWAVLVALLCCLLIVLYCCRYWSFRRCLVFAVYDAGLVVIVCALLLGLLFGGC